MMKVCLFQMNIVWADKKANFTKVESWLHQLPEDTDLIVLPEMFSTGFCIDQMELSETMGGNTVAELKRWAATYQIAISGSLLARENDDFFNRGFFVFPTGELLYADKKHLFSYAGENKLISAGNDRLIVHYKGFNIFLLICYDIRFPVWSRNVNNAYDLLIYTASFPHARMQAWNVLLRARAIENMAYVCGVNRVGKDSNGTDYSGYSVLLDYKGNELAQLKEYEEGVQIFDIEKESLDAFRDKFGFWKDADKFKINP